MEELDDARAKAGDFEDKGVTLDEWLAEKEKELNEWDVLPVDSAALEQQMDKIGEFDQEVAKHYPTVVDLMETEGKLLGADLEQIVPFEGERPVSSEEKPKVKFSEEKKKRKKKGSKEALPAFMLRPGAQEVVDDAAELRRRYEELKKQSTGKVEDVTDLLAKVKKYEGDQEQLCDWLKEKEEEADSVLPVDDLTSDELKKKAEKAKDLKKQLEERQKDKDRLNELLDDLTSGLPDDHPDKEEVKRPCDEVNTKWDDLANRIEGEESKLNELSDVAKGHESDYDSLSDWLGPAKEKAVSLSAVPSDLESIQDQLKSIEELEEDMANHQPQFEACCDSGNTLSDACEDPGKKAEMDKKLDDLQEEWKKLQDDLNKAKEKLQRAAEGGEKLKGLVGDVLGWIDDVQGRIGKLPPVAVKSGLIDDQIKEQKDLMSEVQARSGDVKSAQEVGQEMLADLEGKEKEKMQERLQGLTARFSDLDDILNHRMEELDDAHAKAGDFEGKGATLDEWLAEKEKELNEWDVLPVNSAALEQQMDKIEEFNDEVAKHNPTVVDLMETEGKLLGAEPEQIVPFESEQPVSSEEKPKVKFSEEKKKRKKKGSKEALPAFMLRPGAQEVVDDAAELRRRYEELKKQSTGKVEDVTDLLAKVQKYETDHEQFCDWLSDKKQEIDHFGPVPVTPEEVEKELKKVQDLKDEFEGKEPQLEDVTNLGSQLVDHSGPTTSSEAVKAKLSDTNHTWDDLMDALDRREESLKGGQEKALGYQDCLDNLSKWLKEVEEKLDEPEKTTGDPVEIANQCAETKGVAADIANHKPDLDDLLAKAEELEKTQNLPPGHLGEKDIEERFKAVEEKAKERAEKLDDVLKDVFKTESDLSDLIEALKDVNHPLSIHEPVHVTTDDIQRQLDELEELKKTHDELQPRVEAVVAAGDVFAVPPGEGEDVPDGASTGSSVLSDYLSPGNSDLKEKKSKSSKEQEDIDHPSKSSRKKKGKKGVGKEKSPKPKRQGKDKGEGKGPHKGAAGDKTKPEFTPIDVPSGPVLHCQLEKVKDLNSNNDALLDDWLDKTKNGLETAKKFEGDYDDLYQWIQDKKAELDNVGPVGATEERIKEQMKMVEDAQAALEEKKPMLTAVCDLGGELCKEAVPPDVDFIQEELEKLNTAFGSLEDSLKDRVASLLKGGELSDEYKEARDDAASAIGDKQDKVSHLPPVGSDIETVQAQIEECKSLESEVDALKEKLSKAQDKGRKLMDVCSEEEAQTINDELQDLAAQWNKLNADVYARKHKLEEALLELGQFHDALAELLLWIGNEMAELSNPQPPGVEEDTINKKIEDLQFVKEEITARVPSVESVNEAAGKLVSSSSSGDAPDLKNDIEELNRKWKDLNALCADRDKELAEALDRAKKFHDNRNKELDWLDDMEKRLGSEEKVHGLPDSCTADLEELKALKDEVDSRTGSVKALVPEGEELKPQGNSAEQQQVGGWVEVVQQRYDDLLGSFDDRKHQLDRAQLQAEEFDDMYNKLMEWLDGVEKRQENMDPIHSDHETVQQQLEDNKEIQKDLDEHEPLIDEAVGCGNLLCRECVPEDAEVIQQKIAELQARWDLANTTANDRQSNLEKGLLALGKFEDAYDELMKWLEDAEEQLDNPEAVTGDPDAVGVQLAKHKTFQKQLGSRNASLKLVTKAGEMLLKEKEGEDAELLKEKLDKINEKWDDVCQKSVDRQQKLQDAYKKLGELLSLVGPLRTWLAKMTPHLDEGEPVHGDVDTVDTLMAEHQDVRDQLSAQEEKFEAAKECAEDLINNYLDDPTATKDEVDELVEKWNEACELADNKQARLDNAMEMAKSFEDQHDALMDWIAEKMDHLSNEAPPSDSPAKLDAQIKEQKDLVAELNSKQPELDTALACGQEILDVAHPRALQPMESKLHDLDKKWSKLKAATSERSEALSSALLAMKGLQEMLDNLTDWVDDAEKWLGEKEMEPVSEGDLDAIEQQLADHEAFQEEMENRQPDMDALSKAEKSHKDKGGKSSNDLDKKIRSLHKRWQKLGMKMHERHRLLKEAKDRCNDMEKMKSFDFETWRKKFNGWVDKNKLRPRELLHRSDGNRDGHLTKDELMKALKASGLPTNPVELNQVALVLDPDRTGVYNIEKVLNMLRPEKVKPKKEPQTDSEKIAVEIDRQVSQCTCPKKFKVSRVAEGKYRFGDSQQLRLVRILRSTVMVRVGGGWDPLDVFLRKHDPCRASGRTNAELQQDFLKQRGTKPGLAMAGFRTPTQSALRAKQEAAQPKTTPKTTAPQKGTPSGKASATLTPQPEQKGESKLTFKPRLPTNRQGTPERTGIPQLKSPTRATPTKHMLPRKSPRREGNDPSVGADVKYTPTHTTVKERPVSTELLEAEQDGGQVKGKIRTTTERTTEERGKKTTTTTFRGSKSPSPRAEGVGKTSPAPTKERQGSRIPTPGSKIPTPGGKGRSGTK
jgi:dystonin